MEFLWGAATSGHQIDGNNLHSDWWHWERQGNIETGETSGAAADHWNRYREDLRLAASLGLNSYRFSIEWARLEPQEGQWDKAAASWYVSLLDECESLGLQPMVTLHHFTLPQWLAEKGGLTSDHFVGRFAGYVARVISLIGPRVPLWCTLNEPMNLVVGGYLGGYMPPAKSKPKLAGVASRNLLKAHVKAYDLIHAQTAPRTGPWKDVPLAVGFAHNMIDFRPRHPSRLIERMLSGVFRRFYNRSWLDAVTGRKQHFGVLGLVPYAKPVWEARGRRTVDFIGVNYYTKVYVCWGPQPEKADFMKFKNFPIGVLFSRTGEPKSDLGWAVHPEGLARILRFVRGYGLPIYLTENGIADESDALRPGYLVEHLKQIANAREHGADIRGYYHWSLLDNFEWIKGFPPRFGLYGVDYETQARSERPSAELYRKIIAAHAGGLCPEGAVLAKF